MAVGRFIGADLIAPVAARASRHPRPRLPLWLGLDVGDALFEVGESAVELGRELGKR